MPCTPPRAPDAPHLQPLTCVRGGTLPSIAAPVSGQAALQTPDSHVPPPQGDVHGVESGSASHEPVEVQR